MPYIYEIHKKICDIREFVELCKEDDLKGVVRSLFSHLWHYNESAILHLIKGICPIRIGQNENIYATDSEITVLLFLLTKQEVHFKEDERVLIESTYVESFYNLYSDTDYSEVDHPVYDLINFFEDKFPKSYKEFKQVETIEYSSTDVLRFGMYKGKRLTEIPFTYIYWCICNIPKFSLTYDLMEELLSKKGSFVNVPLLYAVFKNLTLCNDQLNYHPSDDWNIMDDIDELRDVWDIDHDNDYDADTDGVYTYNGRD